MTRHIRFLSAGVFLLILLAPALSGALTDDSILAEVNGETLRLADYKRFLLKVDPGRKATEVDKGLLREAVEERLILQEARTRGISATDTEVEKALEDFLSANSLSKDDFERKIAAFGITGGEYRKWLRDEIILIAKITHEEVDRKVAVSEAEIEAYYRANAAQYLINSGTFSVKAVFIGLRPDMSVTELTDLKIRILKILGMLRKGEQFETLAALYSDEPLRKDRGTLGEFRKGDLTPELEASLASMKEGDVSEPVWVQDGVYILKLAAKTEDSFTPLAEVRENIRRLLLRARHEARYDKWVGTLWEKASIKFTSE